ncbi:MAG: hypothetical protein JKY09_03490 [Crocinitomicaceae bacterium]|nr:hypothetical protein [Crocinitomicaceae bacterium]
MEDELDLVIDSNGPEVNKRPAFLTVLCILTFVGAGLGILGAVFGLVTSDMTERNLQMSAQLMDDSPFGDFFGVNWEEMTRWQGYINMANLIGALLCLTGALMMWRLKKVGYYLYIPGCIIPLVVSAVGAQYMMSGMLAGMSTIGVVFAGMISLAFIIMYGVNLKHLK